MEEDVVQVPAGRWEPEEVHTRAHDPVEDTKWNTVPQWIAHMLDNIVIGWERIPHMSDGGSHCTLD